MLHITYMSCGKMLFCVAIHYIHDIQIHAPNREHLVQSKYNITI